MCRKVFREKQKIHGIIMGSYVVFKHDRQKGITKMELAKQTDDQTIEIGRYEKSLLGEIVAYSLFVKENNGARRYAVSISRGIQRESCFLSDDLFASVAFFEKLVTGDVFPYSLSELVEDFWKASKICAGECT